MKFYCRPNLEVQIAYEIDVQDDSEVLVYTFYLNHISAYTFDVKLFSRSNFSPGNFVAT